MTPPFQIFWTVQYESFYIQISLQTAKDKIRQIFIVTVARTMEHCSAALCRRRKKRTVQQETAKYKVEGINVKI